MLFDPKAMTQASVELQAVLETDTDKNHYLADIIKQLEDDPLPAHPPYMTLLANQPQAKDNIFAFADGYGGIIHKRLTVSESNHHYIKALEEAVYVAVESQSNKLQTNNITMLIPTFKKP